MGNKAFILIMLLASVVVSGCRSQLVNTVAFSRLTGDYWQIWTMRPDGSKARQITTSPSDKRYPVWSYDRQELFFRTNNNEAFIVNPGTGQENKILGSLGLSDGVVPSPDGTELLLVRFSTQLKDISSLWLTTLDGENARILTKSAGLQYNPTWSPNGRRIAYVYGHGYRTDELYIMDSNGKNIRRLTRNEAIEVLPAFAPDSKTITYVSDVTGDYEIWLMDTDSGSCRQLTDSKGIDTRPVWSHDGKRIMFVSNRSGVLHIWVMNKDGSNCQQLTMGPPSADPAWRRK